MKLIVVVLCVGILVATAFYMLVVRPAQNLTSSGRTRHYVYSTDYAVIKMDIPEDFQEHKVGDAVALYNNLDWLQRLGTLRISMTSAAPTQSAQPLRLDELFDALKCEYKESLGNNTTLCRTTSEVVEDSTLLIVRAWVLARKIENGDVLLATVTFTTIKEFEKTNTTIQQMLTLERCVRTAMISGL